MRMLGGGVSAVSKGLTLEKEVLPEWLDCWALAYIAAVTVEIMFLITMMSFPKPSRVTVGMHIIGINDNGGLFMGRNGRAFLFAHVMNVIIGPKEDRQLMTGLHTVADVYCTNCQEVLGWKYERAYEESQKYKEGKYILEKSKIMKENW